MGIRTLKPTSPARRFMTQLTNEEITKKTPEKSLLSPKKRGSGLGLAIVVGGWAKEKQTFKTQRASLLSDDFSRLSPHTVTVPEVVKLFEIANASAVVEDYPFLHVAPNGQVFMVDLRQIYSLVPA